MQQLTRILRASRKSVLWTIFKNLKTKESFALKQKINDRIPKFLPKEVVVAHKTGDMDYFEHDVGIVYTPKGDYIEAG